MGEDRLDKRCRDACQAVYLWDISVTYFVFFECLFSPKDAQLR